MKMGMRMAAAASIGMAASACVRADDRLPPIPLEKYTEAQRKAAREFSVERGKRMFGPFVPLLRSPELMLAAKGMGDYLRSRSAVPPRIAELVILVVCRNWTQQLEWQVHYPLALKAGLRKDVADAIADGRRPMGMPDDEQAAYELSMEILRNKRVSDETYGRALAEFGEQGVVDLLGINGYYTFVATVMNAARTPLPVSGVDPLKRFPD
jgi:4-carboxymuconolactone decarboxylase